MSRKRKQQMKQRWNEKGISLLALIITIIVLLILVIVAMSALFGENGLITKAKYAKFVNEYSQVEEAVKLYMNENFLDTQGKEKQYPITENNITDIKDSLKQTIIKVREEEVEIEDLSLYTIDFSILNLDIKNEYVIDIDTGTIYLLKGVKIGGYIYHIPDIKVTSDGIIDYLITFDSNGGECDVETMKIEANSAYGELPIPTREKYVFVGWFTQPEEGEQIEETDKVTDDITLYAHWHDTLEDYIQDGLVIWYDGVENTRNGHSDSTTTWENLASTGSTYDGTLQNFSLEEDGSWTDDSLILDGVDDWVKMAYLYNTSMTVEIVAKPLDIVTDELIYTYISSYQSGGIGISIEGGKNESRYYISGFKTVQSSDTMTLGQTYSMSTAYDDTNVYFRENGNTYSTTKTKAVEKPESSTIFAIGTNPKGSGESLPSTESKFGFEVYSVRIYNKCLTETERNTNYEVDKKRFNIEELGEKETLGYVEDGLVVLYDGDQNTRYGHSETAEEWENLVSTSYDGVLKNFDFTEASGWTDNSLILDGVNDWVKMKYIYNKEMTVEIVAKPIDIYTDDLQYNYISNYQSGGIGLSIQEGKNESKYYISGYKTLPSDNSIKLNQTYSLSTAYDSSNVYLRENANMYQTSTTKSVTKPSDSTIFSIGTNTSGSSQSLPSGESRFKFEVYSVRIYNRCLTQAELNQNYALDKERFNLDEVAEIENPGYVQNGLVALYDGTKNTRYGHSKTTEEWENLISTEYDGVLKNFDYTETSGWTENSLILDGSNDWVKLGNIHNDTMTIEIVAKPLTLKANKTQNYLMNLQSRRNRN